MNLFGGKKKAKEAKPSASGGGGISFSRVQVVSKPEVVGKLLRGVKEQTIDALASVLTARPGGLPLLLIFEDCHWSDP